MLLVSQKIRFHANGLFGYNSLKEAGNQPGPQLESPFVVVSAPHTLVLGCMLVCVPVAFSVRWVVGVLSLV